MPLIYTMAIDGLTVYFATSYTAVFIIVFIAIVKSC
jgi:hypothetical protein